MKKYYDMMGSGGGAYYKDIDGDLQEVDKSPENLLKLAVVMVSENKRLQHLLSEKEAEIERLRVLVGKALAKGTGHSSVNNEELNDFINSK